MLGRRGTQRNFFDTQSLPTRVPPDSFYGRMGALSNRLFNDEDLHIAEDHFLPELINPDTGKPVNEGAVGEPVFTTLTMEGMPLLRY